MRFKYSAWYSEMSSSFDRGALLFLGASALMPFLLACVEDVEDPSPSTPAAKCARPADNPPLLSADSLALLQRDGIVVVKDCIPNHVLASARAAATQLLRDKVMSKEHGTTEDVRTDVTTWIHSDSTGEEGAGDGDALEQCACVLRGLAFELDCGRASFHRSSSHRAPDELQLSCYNGGSSFYRPHRDAPSLGPSSSIWALGVMGWMSARSYRRRCVTAILYLNEADWNIDQAVDGGALKAYLGAADTDEIGTSAKKVVSVCPSGGTLVVFDSQQVLHEVCPSNRQRFALTAWLCGDYNGVALVGGGEAAAAAAAAAGRRRGDDEKGDDERTKGPMGNPHLHEK